MNNVLIKQAIGRVLYLETLQPVSDENEWHAACREARALGFDAVMLPPLWRVNAHGGLEDPDSSALGDDADESMVHVLARLAAVATKEGVGVLMHVVVDRAAVTSEYVRRHPDWYMEPRGVLDPRHAINPGLAFAKREQGRVHTALIDDWCVRLEQWVQAGVAGFRFGELQGWPAADWQLLIGGLKRVAPDVRCLAWTPGLAADQVDALRDVGFDATFLSLPWWNNQDDWLAQEYSRLNAVAPVIAPIFTAGQRELVLNAEQRLAIRQCMLCTAAVAGVGVMVGQSYVSPPLAADVVRMNEGLLTAPSRHHPLAVLSGPLASTTVILRGDQGLVLNPSLTKPAKLDWSLVRSRLPDGYGDIKGTGVQDEEIAAGGCRRFAAKPILLSTADASTTAQKRSLGLGVMSAPRIALEQIQPALDQGRFAVKATVGRPVQVTAKVFMDGHEQLAVVLAWRAAADVEWHEQRMVFQENDNWQGRFTPTRLGRYQFEIRAWLDVWESFRNGLKKKHDAGADINVDLLEGRETIVEALRRARREPADISQVLERALASDPIDADILLSDELAQAMARLDTRPFLTTIEKPYPVMVERQAASFSAWYEMFPRSQGDAGVHGTFDDVCRRLPAIRDMGFDVLYFPPIHPIGTTNRKGRNNSLSADEGDPGSPYAIGSSQGGHDAIHPQLGTLEDFKRLLREAQDYGLEVALDFAIQCSPDHPWLTEHHNWFKWRVDGSLRYAENPPKRYEDIVNPEFYQGNHAPKPRASLWRSLRDIVLYWIEQGVRIFRVDNPHTKPLPFWEWMLGEIHARHPDTVFLSEAFTRPGMMYRLAKLGFSQSYTYFTWRNDKHELTTYLEELVTAPAALSFRPNFFVNTPDINPYFLQRAGRAGFLIRAALATTLSGSWGMYNGYEICEARALPGREEYLDSEKYELRQWDWETPGNIVAEIAQLNRIRRANPALHTHLGLRFHTIHDDQVLFYSKTTPEKDNIVLIMVSLDPSTSRRPWLELPLWMWRLADDAVVQVEDAVEGGHFELRGTHHQVELTPSRPYQIWRIRRLG